MRPVGSTNFGNSLTVLDWKKRERAIISSSHRSHLKLVRLCRNKSSYRLGLWKGFFDAPSYKASFSPQRPEPKVFETKIPITFDRVLALIRTGSTFISLPEEQKEEFVREAKEEAKKSASEDGETTGQFKCKLLLSVTLLITCLARFQDQFRCLDDEATLTTSHAVQRGGSATIVIKQCNWDAALHSTI
jgi:hypothetical protein